MLSLESGRSVTGEALDQWQAPIVLPRALLHEHHDLFFHGLFFTSQHPSASAAPRRFAPGYAHARADVAPWNPFLPGALPRNPFLPGALRHRLLAVPEHVLTSSHLACSVMAPLYATVPAFEDTWIECPGGLGRYMIA